MFGCRSSAVIGSLLISNSQEHEVCRGVLVAHASDALYIGKKKAGALSLHGLYSFTLDYRRTCLTEGSDNAWTLVETAAQA